MKITTTFYLILMIYQKCTASSITGQLTVYLLVNIDVETVIIEKVGAAFL